MTVAARIYKHVPGTRRSPPLHERDLDSRVKRTLGGPSQNCLALVKDKKKSRLSRSPALPYTPAWSEQVTFAARGANLKVCVCTYTFILAVFFVLQLLS